MLFRMSIAKPSKTSTSGLPVKLSSAVEAWAGGVDLRTSYGVGKHLHTCHAASTCYRSRLRELFASAYDGKQKKGQVMFAEETPVCAEVDSSLIREWEALKGMEKKAAPDQRST